MIVEFSIRPMRQPSTEKAATGRTETRDRAQPSGRPRSMNASIEGSWEQVMAVIQGCHEAHTGGHPRVVTTIVVVDDNANGWPRFLQDAALPVQTQMASVTQCSRRIPIEIRQ